MTAPLSGGDRPQGDESMKSGKLKRLRAAGWKAGSAREFLGLSEQEAALVELKLALVTAVREARKKHGLSQVDLAQRMRSSQSRVAKIETGDQTVFRADGAFVSLPAIPEALLERGFRRAVLQFLVRQGAISEQLRDRMLGWRRKGRQGPFPVLAGFPFTTRCGSAPRTPRAEKSSPGTCCAPRSRSPR
jgi:transcriptional regulator with XRE-family HTH domain